MGVEARKWAKEVRLKEEEARRMRRKRKWNKMSLPKVERVGDEDGTLADSNQMKTCRFGETLGVGQYLFQGEIVEGEGVVPNNYAIHEQSQDVDRKKKNVTTQFLNGNRVGDIKI